MSFHKNILLFSDEKTAKEAIESDKKKEATMDFAANIEKVREVSLQNSQQNNKMQTKFFLVRLVLGSADIRSR